MQALAKLAAEQGCEITQIGVVARQDENNFIDNNGAPMNLE